MWENILKESVEGAPDAGGPHRILTVEMRSELHDIKNVFKLARDIAWDLERRFGVEYDLEEIVDAGDIKEFDDALDRLHKIITG